MLDTLDRSLPARLARHAAASTLAALLSDARLTRLLAETPLLGKGIGGVHTVLDLDGTAVFAKRIPLTDLERRHTRSTANLFDLPLSCQYGVAGPGFGVWREVAAHELANGHMLGGRGGTVPLLHHWRVLDGRPPQTTPEEHADPERTVAYWGGSDAVRQRLAAVAGSTASVVLLLEHLPWNLADWLDERVAAGAAEAAYAMVERELLLRVPLLGGELIHFDHHFRNVLTDGRHLYFGDLGLATSPRFELPAAEREFLAAHRDHDLGYAVMQLVNSVVKAVSPLETWPERFDLVRRSAAGLPCPELPGWAQALVRRHAPAAAVMNDFYWPLHTEPRAHATPFPTAQLDLSLSR
ncbi:serine/threonine protein phosphatase [Catellatospora sp. KI3]|uniref:serine/threonine protein phosphatase n=1 Tax=Catellatospora sp. KI3 TaxID=3041620 RepID=UPI002482F8C3|nr:serine/threonine protein phosphatase [Catellatospora sp. KI3]MDI1462397.1 serine/threonine protein phosphatase [Catellatospora sp. KI3]